MLVLADGMTPQYSRKVDPAQGQITVAVQPLAPEPADRRRVAHGRIVGDRGQPVAGAVIAAQSVHWDDGRGSYGAIEGLDPYAVSDADGRFRLCHSSAVEAIGVDVRAPGLAPRLLQLRTGKDTSTVTLDRGSMVTGTLVADGKGVAGVVVGLVQTNRAAGQFFGEFTIATDEAGHFTFTNVPIGNDYVVYGKMNAEGGRGATEPRPLRVDGAMVETGELAVVPGSKVTGKVVATDGKPLPAGTRVVLSAESAWDSQIAVLDGEGGFAFGDVPKGCYILSVRVPGYRFGAGNGSLSRLRGVLVGRIDRDSAGLAVELEPGNVEMAQYTRELAEQEQRLEKEPMRGITPDGR